MLSFCWWRLGRARWLSMWRGLPARVAGKQRLLPRRTQRCAVHLACREGRGVVPSTSHAETSADTRCQSLVLCKGATPTRVADGAPHYQDGRRCAPPSARAIVRPVTLERSYLLPFDSHHSAAGAKRPVSHADGTGRTVNGWAGQRLGVTKPQPANAPATSARRRDWRRPRGRRAGCPRRAAPGHRAGRRRG